MQLGKLPTRLLLLCLACLTAAVAEAQQSPAEPGRLSHAIQTSAYPLSNAPASRGGEPDQYLPRSVPSFPFRQTSAAETVAGSPSAPPRKLAPRSSGAKRSPERSAAPTPTTAIGTVVSSLAIVIGLFAALVWVSKRFAPVGSAALPKEAVEMLGQAPLAPRQSMQLIRVGNRLLLVALAAGGATTLAEITDAAEVEHLAGLCRRGKSDSASTSFGRVLSQLAAEPAAPSPRTRVRGGT